MRIAMIFLFLVLGVVLPAVESVPVPAGTVLYFAPTGDNRAAGTESFPKRDLTGIDVNHLPADSALRFRAGGTFLMAQMRLRNVNVSAAAPLTFERYGDGERPLLEWTGGFAGFEAGLDFFDGTQHGGYVIRGLHLRGPDTTAETWAFYNKNNVRDVTVEDCEIERWATGFNNQGDHNTTRVRILRNRIHNLRAHGILGTLYDSVIDGNNFSDDNVPQSHLVHRLYLSGGDRNVFSNNVFETDRPCRSGTFTVHGLIPTSLVMENNTVRYGPGGEGWTFSISPYVGLGQQGVRGLVIRGNRITNGGPDAYHVQCAPGALIENNEVYLTEVGTQRAVAYSDDNEVAENLRGPGTVRNNTAYGPAGSRFSFSGPPGSTVENNRVVVWPDQATATSIVITPNPVSVASGATVTLTASVRDQSGQALSTQPTIAWSSTAGSIASNGRLTAPNARGTLTVTARAAGLSADRSVTVTNRAPIVVSGIPSQAATVGTSYTFAFSAGTFRDVEGDALTYSASGMPSGIIFTPATRAFAGTPGTVGSSTVTVTANDGHGGSANTTFLFMVGSVAPPATPSTPPSITDPTNPTPTISGTAGVGQTIHIYDGASEIGTTTTTATGSWSFTPSSPLSAGTHDISYTVSVGNGPQSGHTPGVTIMVDDVPPPTGSTPDSSTGRDSGASSCGAGGGLGALLLIAFASLSFTRSQRALGSRNRCRRTESSRHTSHLQRDRDAE